MDLILKNIGRLYQVARQGESRKTGLEMQDACEISHAWVGISNGKIAGLGTMDSCPDGAKVLDCAGRIVFPGYVDSHTHLIFAATREGEFVDRIRGLSYEEIARKGGGILNSARKLQLASEDELLEGAIARAWEILHMGTTTVEIKSGYGLTVKDELKMLRVARKLEAHVPLRIRRTLLGAHALPMDYREKREDFVQMVLKEMIPQAAEEGLAHFVDVFCDRGFFTMDETERIIQKGADYGLKAKIHANQLDHSGGVQVGVKNGALSVDHLECVGEAEIQALQGSATMPVLLPSAAFFLRAPYQPAREMIDAGLGVALASDYNPGSTPTGNMNFEVALACIRMRMLPQEALVAATLNGAYALDLAAECGSIEVGKSADLVITDRMESFDLIPYFFAKNQIHQVVVKGKVMGE